MTKSASSNSLISLSLMLFSNTLFSVSCKSRALNEKSSSSDPNAWWNTTPELNKEYPFPNEDKWNTTFVDFIKGEMAKNKTATGFHRGFHGKGQACLKGTLTVEKNLPSDYKQGLFSEEKTYNVLSRFSNGNGPINADTVVQPRGLSVKVFGAKGTQLLPTRSTSTTQDFLAVNSPVFPARNIQEFVELSQAQADPKLLPGFLLTHPNTGIILLTKLEKDVGSLLSVRYWSGGAVMWGPRAAKFSFAPCSLARVKQPAGANAEFLTDDLRTRMNAGDACFNFFVQLQTNPYFEPVEDPSIEWQESAAPSQLVGKIVFPKQDFESTDRKDLCEQAAFNPWQGISEHKPLGNIMRSRKAAYLASTAERSVQNKTPIAEPTGNEK
jgi:hypothetical protein